MNTTLLLSGETTESIVAFAVTEEEEDVRDLLPRRQGQIDVHQIGNRCQGTPLTIV